MSKYLIEFTRFEASLVVAYNEDDIMIEAIVNYGTMTFPVVYYLLQNFPLTIEILEKFKTMENVKVTKSLIDLSFDTFYKLYNNKFGKKVRSEKLWSLLSDEEKIKALKYIQQYDQWLIMNAGIAKKYPETYLSQKIWNN
jgi:hypothetical protein